MQESKAKGETMRMKGRTRITFIAVVFFGLLFATPRASSQNPPPALQSISITPFTATINLGQRQQFTATGMYSDGSMQDLSNSVTWALDNARTATISNASGSQGLASAIGYSSALVTATSGGVTGAGVLTVAPPFGLVLTGSLNTERTLPTATMLNNGMVLVTSGIDNNNNSPITAELYNPATGTFTFTGNMTTARGGSNGGGPVATLLNNGKVLIAGGLDISGNRLISAELFDPTTGTFTATGNMTTARGGPIATLLNNGMVLVAGGTDSNFNPIISAELYNPATGAFTATGNMTTPREFHTATLLPDGTVLIAGGFAGPPPFTFPPVTSTEIYNPATGAFTAGSNMTAARAGQTATLLNNGSVLMAGGFAGGSNSMASAELYNPATGKFSATGSMNTTRVLDTATLLNNGMVFVTGGYIYRGPNIFIAVPSTELYDPSTEKFTPNGTMNAARDDHTATLLNNGSVLVAGGDDVSCQLPDFCAGVVLASAELQAGPLSMGPQAMEGNLQLSPGTTLQVGYDFTMPGSHPAATVSFTGANVTFAWTCVSGVASGSLDVPMADQSYADAQGSSAWYPSSDQHSPSVYQGSIAVPDVCSGGLVSFQAGGTFSTSISSTDTKDKVNVRWHYSGGGSAGGWSSTRSVVP